jgi:hypothetical protein
LAGVTLAEGALWAGAVVVQVAVTGEEAYLNINVKLYTYMSDQVMGVFISVYTTSLS